MYHDYASQSYYIKAHTQRLISEAAQARKAQEYRRTEPKTVSIQKKVYFSSFDTVLNPNTLVRHDI